MHCRKKRERSELELWDTERQEAERKGGIMGERRGSTSLEQLQFGPRGVLAHHILTRSSPFLFLFFFFFFLLVS